MTVEVCDEGKGIRSETHVSPAEKTGVGMGLSGMRERVRELGGRLKVQSGEKGTTVVAAFPPTESVAISAGSASR